MADISSPALATAIEKVHNILPDCPNRIETFSCDVSKEEQVKAMVAHLDSWGGVDVMFNNAGIMHAADADAIDTPMDIWDLTHNINVKGVLFGSKYAVLSMRKYGKKKGSIINTGSVVALVGSATAQIAYTASKGAVLALTRELAIVHAREGFRFNALCPAPLKYVSCLFYLFRGILAMLGPLTEEVLTAIRYKLVPLSCKTGSATTQPSAIDEKYTFQPAASASLSSRPMPSSFLPAMKAHS